MNDQLDLTDPNEVLPPDYQEYLDGPALLFSDQEYLIWLAVVEDEI